MSTISTSSRNRAIVAASAFTIGALTVMLQDIIDLRHPLAMWDAWSMKHTLAVLTIIGVTMIAEEGWAAYKAGRPVVAVGISLVVAAGLLLIIYNSVGRQIEAVGAHQLVAQDHNDKITAAKARLAKAEKAKADADKDAIKTSAEKSCKSTCKDVILNTQKDAAAEVEAARSALNALGAPMAVAPKVEFWADTLAIVNVPKDLTRKVAEHLEYPLLTLLFEIGAMVSWCYVRREETVVEQPLSNWRPSATDTAQSSFPVATDPPEPPPGNRNNRRKREVAKPSATVLAFPTASNRRPATVSEFKALAWLRAFMESNLNLPSQDDMATELDVHKGTVAKWLKKWEAEGLIVREQAGRCKTVRMA